MRSKTEELRRGINPIVMSAYTKQRIRDKNFVYLSSLRGSVDESEKQKFRSAIQMMIEDVYLSQEARNKSFEELNNELKDQLALFLRVLEITDDLRKEGSFDWNKKIRGTITIVYYNTKYMFYL